MNTHEQIKEVDVQIDANGVGQVRLDGGSLTIDVMDKLLGHPLCIRIADDVLDRVQKSHAAVAQIAAQDKPAYGINTGFGHLCHKRIAPDEVETLQRNLIISHGVGVGESIADELVRWMILLKVHSLAHGVSGAAPTTLGCLCDMLRYDVLPIVPSQGSLGASGDLAPLAHMTRPMLSLGSVRVAGETMPATAAFERFGISPITLGPKEGLALINGTQFIGAHAATIAVRAKRLIKHADIIATMSLEGFGGSVKPFDERLHDHRPHLGAMEVAKNVRMLMQGSEVLADHAECGRVQDPYSIRCVPQVHGASRDALRHATQVVETEINSVTDNPLVFDNEVISGGNFHAQPLALILDYLAIALSELGSISERRLYLLLSGQNDLPVLLMENTGLNSGFMLPQYTSAALASENKVLSSPASVDSIPTSLGQEDHVSMGAIAARKCLRVLENVETILAIELMCAAQAMDFRDPLLPGVGPRIAREVVRKRIPHAEEDRLFGDDIEMSLEILRSQEIVRDVENGAGKMS